MTKPSKKNIDIEAKVIAKAWKDPAFKKKLLSNPRTTLTEMGYKVPENINIVIHEDNASTFTFVLHPSPADVQKLSDSELEKIAAACVIDGSCWFSW